LFKGEAYRLVGFDIKEVITKKREQFLGEKI
jgi:hypothetical protein